MKIKLWSVAVSRHSVITMFVCAQISHTVLVWEICARTALNSFHSHVRMSR